MIPEPKQPEYFLDSFPRDDFPRYAWTDRPAPCPLPHGRPKRRTVTVSKAACR